MNKTIPLRASVYIYKIRVVIHTHLRVAVKLKLENVSEYIMSHNHSASMRNRQCHNCIMFCGPLLKGLLSRKHLKINILKTDLPSLKDCLSSGVSPFIQ